MISTKVVGDKALIKKLLALGPKAATIVRKEMRPVAKEVANKTKPLVPVDTGRLRKSIAIRPVKKKRRYTVAFRVVIRMPKDDTPFYGFAPNFGVKKGRGIQKKVDFMHKGLQGGLSGVDKMKERILAGIANHWRKK